MRKPISFFLVDDDTDDASLFKEVLVDINPAIGFQWAGDGQDALEQLKITRSLPDLIFLDLNMPRMGGKEFLLQIKTEDSLSHIPVIIYSTSSYSKDIEETIMYGAMCFITKPSNIKDIKYILSSIADNIHSDLDKCLRVLSGNASTFIVC